MHKKKGGEMQLQLLQLLESLTTFSLSPIWQLDASIPTPSNYLKVQKILELCLLLPIQQNPHIHYGCFNFNLPYLYKFPLSSTICLHNSLPVHLPQVFFPIKKGMYSFSNDHLFKIGKISSSKRTWISCTITPLVFLSLGYSKIANNFSA